MSEPPKYLLELTEKQVLVLMQATEVLSRLGLGQFWTILENIGGGVFDDKLLMSYELRKEYDLIANALFKEDVPLGAYYGINSPKVHDRHRIAFDLLQVMRHRISWDRYPEGGIGVSFDKPLDTSTEPLPVLKQKDKP